MATATIEERLAALEADMARLKAQAPAERYGVIGRTNPQAIEAMFGQSAGDALAEAVWQEILAEREREREEARNAPDDEES